MFDSELLASLDTKDKERYLKSLNQIITQIDIAQEEFKNLKELFVHLTEHLPNACWVLNSDGTLFLENSEALNLRGLFELIDLQKSSDEIEFEECYYLIQTNKKLDKIIVSATNITIEKRKERLVSMGQVAAHLAHEIRNPIGSVSLLASTLLKRVDIKSKPLVVEIKKSIWRVERIIKATLLFSKGVTLSNSHFSLNSLKDELDSAMGFYTFSKDIELKCNFLDRDVYGDFDLLSIVFQNFLFNSIDAIEECDEIENGLIEIEFYEDLESYRFKIYDNGKEIENKDILFEPFKSTKTKGNGLGLALSLQIVYAHCGKIELLDEKRKGFLITLAKEANY